MPLLCCVVAAGMPYGDAMDTGSRWVFGQVMSGWMDGGAIRGQPLSVIPAQAGDSHRMGHVTGGLRLRGEDSKGMNIW